MLWFTHALAALTGGLVVYLGMTFPRRRSIDRENLKTAVFAFAAAMVLVGAGVQLALVQKAADRYRDQQTCLNAFAADLVTTINARRVANARLDAAESAKDAANDRVVEVVAFGSRIPPEANKADFTEALEAFVTAKTHLSEVRAQVRAELAENPYPEAETPEAACSR